MDLRRRDPGFEPVPNSNRPFHNTAPLRGFGFTNSSIYIYSPHVLRGPAPERAIAGSHDRRSLAAAGAVPPQIRPRFRRLAICIGQRDELLLAVHVRVQRRQGQARAVAGNKLDVDVGISSRH